MNQVNIVALPDQSFSITLEGVLYDLRIFLAANVMCCDLSINSVPILTTMRLVAGAPIIPYHYLENGNFIINTLNDELPFYTEFGITQFLIYFTEAELQAIENE